jgi:hypothetical protein
VHISTPLVHISTPLVHVSTPLVHISTPLVHVITPLVHISTPLVHDYFTIIPASVPVFIRLQAIHRLTPTPLLVTRHKVRWCITATNTITKTHGMRNINFLLQKLTPRKSRILQTQSSVPCSQ